MIAPGNSDLRNIWWSVFGNNKFCRDELSGCESGCGSDAREHFKPFIET